MLKKLFTNWYFIGFLLFAFCLAVEMLWLSVFYPAAMTNDSFSIWKQSAVGFGYLNLQPYLYTWFLHLLRILWDSPAIVTIIQALISSILVSYSTVLLLKNKANKWLVAGGYLAFVFSIPILTTNIAVLRDTFGAQLLLILSIFMVNLSLRRESNIPISKSITLGVLLALFASVRYDAAVYFIFVPLIIYVYKLLDKKNLLIVIFSSLTLYFLIQVPLAGLLQVKETRFLQMENLETKLVSGIYKDRPDLFSQSDLEIMTQIAPLATWRKYDPTNDATYWNEYVTAKFWDKNFKSSWDKLSWQKIKEHPIIIIKDRYFIAKCLIWDGHWFQSPWLEENKLNLAQTYPLGAQTSNTFFSIWRKAKINPTLRFFIWTPFYLIVNLTFLIISIIRKKDYLVIYCLLGLILIPATLVGVTSGTFRYFYPIFYASFFIPALYTIKAGNEH